MNYLFEDTETGEAVEVEMDVEDAVELGGIISIGDRVLRRAIVMPNTQVAVNLCVSGWGRTPGTCPGADAYFDPVSRTFSKDDVTGEGVPHWDRPGSLQDTERLSKGAQTFQQLAPKT